MGCINNNYNGWSDQNRWSYGDGGTQLSTATIMNTGQTTSYRTGDDADLLTGRLASFLVLAENNPFGNTNRFTAIDGTQTYTANIAIDWSTYNGTEVLGWYMVRQTAAAWNTAIDNGLAFSTGSYTSGWRLPNIMELISLIDWEQLITQKLYYPPFNFTSTNLISSTTCKNTTTTCYYLSASTSIPIFTVAKATAIEHMFCRTFTVSGTTLT